MPIDLSRLRLMAPGERRLALWAGGRIQKVQGDSRQLVAGAYMVLAAVWGSLGAVIGLVGIMVEIQKNSAGLILIIVGIAFGAVSFFRQAQSRAARRRDDP